MNKGNRYTQNPDPTMPEAILRQYYASGKDERGYNLIAGKRRVRDSRGKKVGSRLKKEDNICQNTPPSERKLRNLNNSIQEVKESENILQLMVEDEEERGNAAYELILKSAQTRALNRIIELMESKTDSVALRSATYLIDRYHGTPCPADNMDGKGKVDFGLKQIIISPEVHQQIINNPQQLIDERKDLPPAEEFDFEAFPDEVHDEDQDIQNHSDQ